LLNGFTVKPVMAAEFAVLGCDDCAHKVRGDVGKRSPVALCAVVIEQHRQSGRDRDYGVDRRKHDAAGNEIERTLKA